VKFAAQAKAVCDTYLAAPALEQSQGTHTVCVDEMTGLQALERDATTNTTIPRGGRHRLLDVAGGSGLRPRRTDRRRSNSPVAPHVPDQAQGPFRVYSNSISWRFPAIIGLVGVPLQRLQARHLVHADRVRPLALLQRGRRKIRVTDGLGLRGELHRVRLGGIEPVPTLVRLQGGLAE